jgi:hypothetical protein
VAAASACRHVAGVLVTGDSESDYSIERFVNLFITSLRLELDFFTAPSRSHGNMVMMAVDED